MLANVTNWLDDRTGLRRAVSELLFQQIPGGAKWRYVWGTTLAFAVVIEFVTGFFLWMHYSASTQTAWESVYYIEHEMTGGWLLRGIHHFTAHVTMVLLALHLLQVILYRAYKAPREVNYWLGLGMMLIILALGQTGYLLPWDQRGNRATQIATTIAGVTPVVGDQVKTVAVGGDEFGHHTLTRFLALHAGLLPAVLLLLMVLHIAVGRRHGHPDPEEATPDAPYWPDQAVRDATACLAVLATVVFLTTQVGAELGPPSDPTVDFNSARPEWYFLFLFQFLKFFEGETGMFIAAQLVPGLILGVLALMPFIGRWKLGHRFNVLFVFSILAGIIGLTSLALYRDYNGTTPESLHFADEVALAHSQAERTHELAHLGIPPEGAKMMLRNDPKTGGYQLFVQHCAACHDHYDTSTEEIADRLLHIKGEEPTASNLYGFGSRAWMEGMLDPEQINGPQFFGHTLLADGEMVEWVNDSIGGELADLPDDEKQAFRQQIKATAWAISAQAELPYQAEIDARDTEQIAAGMDIALNELSCVDCHKMSDDEDTGGELGTAPDLTRYASHEWLKGFIKNPHTERFYYSEDSYDEADRLMPGFAVHDDDPSLNTLTDRELDLIVRYLRRDWPAAEHTAAEHHTAGHQPGEANTGKEAAAE